MTAQAPEFDAVLAHEASAFREAVKAILTGDADRLRALLDEHPDLICGRSASAHRGTLLHYVAANGIEDELQRTPPNAVEIANILLTAGAEVDAVCGTYGGGSAQTTLNLLVSSGHPAAAGVQAELVRVLCQAGARIDGLDDDGSPLMTALAFGYPRAAAMLIDCGARLDCLVFAAAAGRADLVEGYIGDDGQPIPDVGQCRLEWFQTSADPRIAAQQALVFASMCGHGDVVRLLLDRGVDIAARPPGTHVTETAVHTAAWQGHADVVRLLIARGADLTIKDDRYNSTPGGWAEHAGHHELAELLKPE